jgi:hypothetical protein
MEYTFKELKKKTAAQLKEIASGIEHEAVQGYTQLNKDHLLKAICTALNIDMFEHHKAVGIDKTSIKSHIKELKKKRDELIKANNYAELKKLRRKMKLYKNKLRRAVV